MQDVVVFKDADFAVREVELPGILFLPLARSSEWHVDTPLPRVAYARHPTVPRRLVPFASYHGQVLREKADDAITLVTALGCSEAELTFDLDIETSAKADLKALFGVSVAKGEKSAVVWRSSGRGGNPRPLPPLTWIGEPGWRAVVDGRLSGVMTSFSLSFTYERRTSIDAELAGVLKKFKIHLGGEFMRRHAVSFSLRGTFPELERPGRRW